MRGGFEIPSVPMFVFPTWIPVALVAKGKSREVLRGGDRRNRNREWIFVVGARLDFWWSIGNRRSE